MVFAPPGMGYDRAITIFSPDGRLFQVEYAFEAVKKGATTLGVRCPEGVVLAVEKRVGSRLMESTEKIKIIDEHVGLAFAGLFGDARVLIDQARIYAQVHRLVYGEKVPVELLAKRICDIKQIYTQHGGVRPFGVAFLFAGVDRRGPQLIETDPGGSYTIYKARAIGSGAQKAMELLEKEYKDSLTLDDALKLALKALNTSMEGKISPERVEIAVISVKDAIFRILPYEEVRKHVTALLSEKTEEGGGKKEGAGD